MTGMPEETIAKENPVQRLSIRDLPPLETGGVEARQGIGLQDHLAAGFCIHMITTPDLTEVWCERHDDTRHGRASVIFPHAAQTTCQCL